MIKNLNIHWFYKITSKDLLYKNLLEKNKTHIKQNIPIKKITLTCKTKKILNKKTNYNEKVTKSKQLLALFILKELLKKKTNTYEINITSKNKENILDFIYHVINEVLTTQQDERNTIKINAKKTIEITIANIFNLFYLDNFKGKKTQPIQLIINIVPENLNLIPLLTSLQIPITNEKTKKKKYKNTIKG